MPFGFFNKEHPDTDDEQYPERNRGDPKRLGTEHERVGNYREYEYGCDNQ